MQQQRNNKSITEEDKTVIQLIVFRAGNEEFGVKIDAVREIIKLGMVTPIPESPEFIKGIINVRGEIVTAIDIKSRFFLPENTNSEAKHIVVTKKDDNLFGLIVDEVIEVLRIFNKDIQPPPTLFDRINEKYVSGIVSHENRLIILLDLDRLLSHHELVSKKRNKKLKDKTHLKNTGLSHKSIE